MSATLTADAKQAAGAAAPSVVDVVDDPLELASFTRWSTGADGQRCGESSLQVSGMVCAACAGLIENALVAVPGVQSARVSAAAQRATVVWDPARTRVSTLIGAVRRAGYDAVPDAALHGRALREAERRQALWRLFVASFCMMQVMMFATPSYVAGPGEIEPELARLLNWGSWVLSLPVLLFSAVPFFAGAWRSLRLRRMGMDVPVAIGIAVTFVASTGAAFDPGGPFGHEVYFDSLTMFVSFLLGGRWLELRARHRAAEALEAALARMPRRPGACCPTVAWSRSACSGCGRATACACPPARPFRPTARWATAPRRPTSRCSPANRRRWPRWLATCWWAAA
jgi:P-type Cu2+ transporter